MGNKNKRGLKTLENKNSSNYRMNRTAIELKRE